jgi:hypothetical protein
MGPLPRARPVCMVSPDFVEDRRVQRNVERSALSVEDHTRSLHRGVADTIALPRPHFREVLAPSLDIVVREASPFSFRRRLRDTHSAISLFYLFQVFRTAPRHREHPCAYLKEDFLNFSFFHFCRSNPLLTSILLTLVTSSEWFVDGRSARRLVTSFIPLATPCPLPSIDAVDSTTRRIYSTPWHASMSPRGTTLPWLHRLMRSRRVLLIPSHGQ